eukprot:119118-Pyramimonas_sp.AAC.1
MPAKGHGAWGKTSPARHEAPNAHSKRHERGRLQRRGPDRTMRCPKQSCCASRAGPRAQNL